MPYLQSAVTPEVNRGDSSIRRNRDDRLDENARFVIAIQVVIFEFRWRKQRYGCHRSRGLRHDRSDNRRDKKIAYGYRICRFELLLLRRCEKRNDSSKFVNQRSNTVLTNSFDEPNLRSDRALTSCELRTCRVPEQFSRQFAKAIQLDVSSYSGQTRWEPIAHKISS